MEKRALFSNKWLGMALVLPQVLLVFTFFYWPTGEALYWAFTLERPWGGGNDWVGFANFATMLGDPVYWASVVKSMVFAFATTGLGMGLALILALLADRELRGYRIYRTALVWPYAIAAPALGLAFRFILAPQAGFMAFLNHIWPGSWDPVLNGFDAMIAIIIAYVWKSIGYNFIFFLAALQ
ncbi:MAG TPA: sugar ABC transporter permease, partial [Candidatus Binatia bacterium]|nr:sugar ABC transporter permease [Candidatus Binatia bacterium]